MITRKLLGNLFAVSTLKLLVSGFKIWFIPIQAKTTTKLLILTLFYSIYKYCFLINLNAKKF